MDEQRLRWEPVPPAPAQLYERFPDLPPLFVQVLYARGFTTEVQIRAFLAEDGASCCSPFEMPGMAEAVQLIRAAITAAMPIAVYGDYDADGVTATALLTLTLRSLGAKVIPYIPNRFDEGYGLHEAAIRELAAQGVRLLLSVDCGIRAEAEVALARRLGMRVVITDHHHLGERLPPADAVINPRREGTPAPLHHLAGVGVAYALAEALLRVERRVPLRGDAAPPEAEALLDLVAVGTVADLVPLREENRRLVRLGLRRLNAAPRPGLRALRLVSGVEGDVDEETIAYQLAPRLNAAGRLRDARLALDLLLAEEEREAMALAEALERLNLERRRQTRRVQRAAERRVRGIEPLPPLLFAADADWPPGVIGLAAGRLAERFHRPVVIVHKGEEHSVGSCRSPAHFHITRALEAVSDLLLHYGGHASAAGFTVRTEALPALQARLMDVAARGLDAAAPEPPPLQPDAETALHDLSLDVYRLFQRLAPFGVGNPPPLLLSRGVHLVSARVVGRMGDHLKLRLADGEGKLWDAIAFGQGALAKSLGRRVDLVYRLRRNEWHGHINLELEIEAIVPSEARG